MSDRSTGSLRLDGAIAAFGEWMATRVSPRDAVAQHVDRTLAPAVRAEVANVVYGAIRDHRRLGWLLGAASELDGEAFAAAMVLAQCVAMGTIEPAGATQRLRLFTRAAVDFGAVLDVDERLAAVADPTEQFGLRHSLPDWLARQFFAEFGDEAEAVVAALDQTPPRTIRANRIVGDRQALAHALAEEGVSTSFTRYSTEGLIVGDETPLFALAAYRNGAFEQQDEGSQLVAAAVAPPPRGRVLDACAGSGGKSLAIASALGNVGSVLACDVHAARIEALRLRARRARASNLQALPTPPEVWTETIAAFAAKADRILLDVPCTGTGSWRRRPEARWDLQPTDLDGLLAMQRELLDRAITALQPGARVVYATCSLWRTENEGQVEAALQRHPGIERVRLAEVFGGAVAAPISDPGGAYLTLRPDRHGTDGFFAAILRRRRKA